MVCLERCAPSPMQTQLSRHPPPLKNALLALPLDETKNRVSSAQSFLSILRNVETNIDVHHPHSLFSQSSSTATSEARLKTRKLTRVGPWAELRLRNAVLICPSRRDKQAFAPMIQRVAQLTSFSAPCFRQHRIHLLTPSCEAHILSGHDLWESRTLYGGHRDWLPRGGTEIVQKENNGQGGIRGVVSCGLHSTRKCGLLKQGVNDPCPWC
jgi:hypothetical protein